MTDDVPDPVASSAPTAPAPPGDTERGDAYVESRTTAIFPVAGATAGTVPAVVHPDADRPVEDE